MTKDEIKYIDEEVYKILHRGVVPIEEGRNSELREKLSSTSYEELKSLFWLESIVQMKVLEYKEDNWKESISRCESQRNQAYQEIEVLEKTLKEEREKETSYYNFKALEAEYNMNLSKVAEKLMTTKVIWFIMGSIVMFLFK